MKSPIKPTYVVDSAPAKRAFATPLPRDGSGAPHPTAPAVGATVSIDELGRFQSTPVATFGEALPDEAVPRSTGPHAQAANENAGAFGATHEAPRGTMHAVQAIAAAVRGMSPQQLRGMVTRALEPGGAGEKIRAMLIDWLERVSKARQQATRNGYPATVGYHTAPPPAPSPEARVDAPVAPAASSPATPGPLRFQMVDLPFGSGGRR